MEITCTRCHQTIPADGLYCPSCGLPQLVYGDEEAFVPAQAGTWAEPARDPGAVEWKPALKALLLLAIPAGLLFWELSLLGLFLAAAAAAWAVSLYLRRQRTVNRFARITSGAGARIGLVTGLITGWIAFATMGGWLFAQRFALHQGQSLDDIWSQAQEISAKWQAAGATQQDAAALALLNTPEGRVGMILFGILCMEFMLIVFAAAGGALSAKLIKAGNRE